MIRGISRFRFASILTILFYPIDSAAGHAKLLATDT